MTALSRLYIVVPFSLDATGALRPGNPIRIADRDEALRAAERTSVFVTGVAVLEDESDEAAGLFYEPRLIARHGVVPSALLSELAVA